MIPWLPSYRPLHLDEPCYCYTTEHGIKQVARESFFGPLLKDQSTFMERRLMSQGIQNKAKNYGSKIVFVKLDQNVLGKMSQSFSIPSVIFEF